MNQFVIALINSIAFPSGVFTNNLALAKPVTPPIAVVVSTGLLSAPLVMS